LLLSPFLYMGYSSDVLRIYHQHRLLIDVRVWQYDWSIKVGKVK